MFKKLLAISVLCAVVAADASADAVIKLGLSETQNSDIEYTNGVLSTIDDGVAASIGDQTTGVEFVGFLEGVLADFSDGSFTIDNVVASGSAQLVGSAIIQTTLGGFFALYDASNTLLLSGVLGDGVVSGSTIGTTGSFFNTTIATFDGGSLLGLVNPTPAGISIALAGISTGGVGGLQVDMGTLQNFVGSGTAVIDAEIPEPATAALLLSGVLFGAARRRKS